MGKIMYNGKPYSGSFDKAVNISYDNSSSGLKAGSVQGAIDEVNTKINNVGKVYKCTNLVAVTATQKTSNFGSLTLPAGTYMVTGSAKHATSGGICKIGIGTSDSSMPTSNGQDIYGNAGYDVNMGNVTRFINLTVETTLYFQTWAASDFEITPMEFSAIRIV